MTKVAKSWNYQENMKCDISLLLLMMKLALSVYYVEKLENFRVKPSGFIRYLQVLFSYIYIIFLKTLDLNMFYNIDV